MESECVPYARVGYNCKHLNLYHNCKRGLSKNTVKYTRRSLIFHHSETFIMASKYRKPPRNVLETRRNTRNYFEIPRNHHEMSSKREEILKTTTKSARNGKKYSKPTHNVLETGRNTRNHFEIYEIYSLIILLPQTRSAIRPVIAADL